VPIDTTLIAKHESFVDARRGVRERFLELRAGPGRTVGVLREPLESRKALGWVVVHSFADEFVYLNRAEVTLARRLASAGFPTLMFHCQGYGDSEYIDLTPRFATHLADSEDVIGQFTAVADVAEVGVVGMRLGATIAARVAERTGVGSLAMIAPIVRGDRYVRDLLRTQTFVHIAAGTEETGSVEGLRRTLDTTGSVNVRGFSLDRDVLAEIEAIDLCADLTKLEAKVLLVQATRTARRESALDRLSERLVGVGASVDSCVVTHPSAALFGGKNFQAAGTDRLADVLSGLNEAIADTVVGWSTTGHVPGAEGSAR
jgi:pimeloyl-ACP methyl ester carboxylesterase